MDYSLKEGQEFTTCELFLDAVKQYEKEVGAIYKISNSSGHNEHATLKFLSVTMKCERAGVYKPKGKGIRQIPSKKTNCRAEIRGYARGKKLRINYICHNHNHDLKESSISEKKTSSKSSVKVAINGQKNTTLIVNNTNKDEDKNCILDDSDLESQMCDSELRNVVTDTNSSRKSSASNDKGSNKHIVETSNDEQSQIAENDITSADNNDLSTDASINFMSDENEFESHMSGIELSTSTTYTNSPKIIDNKNEKEINEHILEILNDEQCQTVPSHTTSTSNDNKSKDLATKCILDDDYLESQMCNIEFNNLIAVTKPSKESTDATNQQETNEPTVEISKDEQRETDQSYTMSTDNGNDIVATNCISDDGINNCINLRINSVPSKDSQLLIEQFTDLILPVQHNPESLTLIKTTIEQLKSSLEVSQTVNLTIPQVTSVGRPKGLKLNVIGLETQQINKIFDKRPKEFQIIAMLEWLSLQKGMITNILDGEYKMLVEDLKNLQVQIIIQPFLTITKSTLRLLKKYMAKETFEAFSKIIAESISKKKFICGSCHLKLKNESILCEACYKWYDYSCQNITDVMLKKSWFCSDCEMIFNNNNKYF